MSNVIDIADANIKKPEEDMFQKVKEKNKKKKEREAKERLRKNKLILRTYRIKT